MAYGTNVIRIWASESVAASGNAESPAFNLDWYHLQGFFSMQILLTGDGTGKFQYGLSNDKTNFIYSATAGDDIVTSFTKTTGPGSDGKNIYSFDPPIAGWMKFKVTETGGADSIVVTAQVAMG